MCSSMSGAIGVARGSGQRALGQPDGLRGASGVKEGPLID